MKSKTKNSLREVEGVAIVALAVPLWLINTFGGIVAIVWLLLSGGWKTVVFGIIVCVVGFFAASITIALGGLGVMLVNWALEKRQKFLLFIGVLTMAVIDVVGIFVISTVAFSSIASTEGLPRIPIGLLAYSVALFPWASLAGRDTNDGTILGLTFISVGLFASTLSFMFAKTTPNESLIWLLLAMVVYFFILLIVPTKNGLRMLSGKKR